MQGVVTRATARPSWCPGVAAPTHLDGSLPADYGFDPLNLGADPDALKWYVSSLPSSCSKYESVAACLSLKV